MIEQNRDLKIENVLSLRKKMTQTVINTEIADIGRFLEKNGFRKVGPIVTTTFGIGNDNGQTLLDMEILVPIDRKADLPAPYSFKNLFHLKFALYSRHEGNPQLLQNTLNKMAEFMKENNLTQITPVYSVNIKELQPGGSPDDMIVDIYIGINPSVL